MIKRLITALLVAQCTVVPLAAEPAPPVTDKDFCIRVQQRLAGTTLVSGNTIYDNYPDFRHSKTTARPLGTHQYVMPAADGSGGPGRVSCKIKTPDHLVAEYGPEAAQDRGLGCLDINRDTARDVYASFSADERARLAYKEADVVFDLDVSTFMGSSWIGDYNFVYAGTDGRLHLKAKALRVDWDNIWLSWAPDRLRGAWYCHLVTPEYLRRLALGAVKPPAAP
jgi:hypothetical protein